TETLALAGTAAGLPRELAAKLARATVTGSGELLNRSPLDPETLRQNVTSTGGTTAAALDVLMAADGLGPLMNRAVAAAPRRSREPATSSGAAVFRRLRSGPSLTTGHSVEEARHGSSRFVRLRPRSGRSGQRTRTDH